MANDLLVSQKSSTGGGDDPPSTHRVSLPLWPNADLGTLRQSDIEYLVGRFKSRSRPAMKESERLVFITLSLTLSGDVSHPGCSLGSWCEEQVAMESMANVTENREEERMNHRQSNLRSPIGQRRSRLERLTAALAWNGAYYLTTRVMFRLPDAARYRVHQQSGLRIARGRGPK
jgi:hypothetical protein